MISPMALSKSFIMCPIALHFWSTSTMILSEWLLRASVNLAISSSLYSLSVSVNRVTNSSLVRLRALATALGYGV